MPMIQKMTSKMPAMMNDAALPSSGEFDASQRASGCDRSTGRRIASADMSDHPSTSPDESDDGGPNAYGEFPLKHFLGMEVTGREPGYGDARLRIGADHLNPNGVVHGAVLFALVDTAMGKATMSVLDEGLFCASIEVSLRFIRPAAAGELTAIANVVKRGRSVVHLEARVVGDDERLIATSAGTFAIIG